MGERGEAVFGGGHGREVEEGFGRWPEAGVGILGRQVVYRLRRDSRRGRLGAGADHVAFDRRGGVAAKDRAPAFEKKRAVAELGHVVHGVGDEHDHGAAREQPFQALVAFLAEKDVADGQRLVDDEDFGLEARGHGKGQAQEHAARIGLDRLVEVDADVGEGGDIVHARLDDIARDAEHGGVDVDVLPAGEFRLEAGAELEKRRGALGQDHLAGRGFEHPGEDLQQGGFAGPVLADDAEGLAGHDLEGDVAKGPVLAEKRLAAGEKELAQPVLGTAVELVHLGDAPGGDDRGHGIRRHRRKAS